MATVIKPTAISNFKSRATANSKWMIVVGANYSIAAFEDNTRIFRNGAPDTTLNRQEVSTRFYSTGDVISTDVGKGFSFSGTAGGKTGICYAWEGTLFGARVDRFTPTFYYTATREPATVTITRQTSGTVVVNADVVQKDELKTYQSADNDDQLIVTSNKPIAVYVDDIEGTAQGSDSHPLYPGSTELFGTFSSGGHIIAGAASTNYIVRGTNGIKTNSIINLIGGIHGNPAGVGGGGSFSGPACKVISDKPIFCESQADGDGGEMTPFVSREAFGTEFVIPEDENEWVKLVSDVPATYEVFDSANVYIGGGSLTGTFYDSARTYNATHSGERVGGIYQAYLGSATEGSSNLTRQKNLIRTSAPVYGLFESEDDDETVLFARVKNNSSVHINPKIVTDGLTTLLDAGNSKSYSGSGTTWKDLSPNQQDATMNSAPSFTTVDNIKHFDLDGTDDYFEISNYYNMNITNAVTASCWVKSNTTNWNNTGWLMSKRNQFLLHPRTPNKQFDWYIHDGAFRPISVSNASFDITQWHNWTGTYDGSYLRLYLNGIQVNSSAQSGTLTSSTSSLFIGQDLGTRFGDARIAYCMVYNKALTASEVKQNFEAVKGRFGL